MFGGIRFGSVSRSLITAAPPQVFPRFGLWVLAGTVLGLALAAGMRYAGVAVVWPRILLGTLGAIFGALFGMMMAVAHGAPADSHPSEAAHELWDPWLDEDDAGVQTPPGPGDGPARAAVRPRVLLPETGETFPLEDEILSSVKDGKRGVIRITGPVGSGKSMAIGHLRAVMPPLAPVRLLDEPDVRQIEDALGAGLVVYASERTAYLKLLATYRLAPWSRDERMEYLLATAREQCGSVLKRLHTNEHEVPDGNPELWAVVLDCMSADGTVQGPRHALQRALAEQLRTPAVRALVEAYCLVAVATPWNLERDEFVASKSAIAELSCARWLRHRAVRLLLAAERIVDELRGGEACPYLRAQLPPDLVRQAGTLIASDELALQRLRDVLALEDRTPHAMAASLLHAARVGWMPEAGQRLDLSRAHLERAVWPEAELSHIELAGADLSAATLVRSKLRGARLNGARLHAALLTGAILDEATLCWADLSHADLRGSLAHSIRCGAANMEGANFEGAFLRNASFARAKLAGACFRNANLVGAELEGADIAGADFTGADLSDASLPGLVLQQAQFECACFERAKLSRCNLEEMHLPGARFPQATLCGALLTGSRMPFANFRGASLRNAGLAEVEWENACLRGANLRGATFHLGSTRSGLVDSPIACEGSRTGFYTDDFDDRDFKAPEEIRKANLRGADLRGANIGGVDFYLVDLRDALYDPAQAGHLRRCGAILEHRA